MLTLSQMLSLLMKGPTDPLKTEAASPQNPAPVPTSCEQSTVLLLITLEAKLNKFNVSHFILRMKTLHVDLELFRQHAESSTTSAKPALIVIL